MTTFTVNLDNVKITIEGNSPEEVINVLHDQNLSTLIYNHFYFSKTTEQRTGNGWIELSSMNEKFIVNAFVARLSEYIKQMYTLVSSTNDSYLTDAFIETLHDLAYVAEARDIIVRDNDLPLILNGLVYELGHRATLDNQFDEEDDDMVSSDYKPEMEVDLPTYDPFRYE